ncbi:MAG: hypothetical protein ACOVNP_00970 [Flavobacterium sp.]|jgi:hypothetical protein
MGYLAVRFVGAVVYWVFTKFEKPFKECMLYKHAFVIGFIFIIVVFYLVLYLLYLMDGG